MTEEEEVFQPDIEVYGAREHNLKNIDVVIPHRSLTVITGLSGSGKSSLAFDTLFAEGQRRYIETFSAYARNFLGGLRRPDVDKISGLSPVISIEQKTTNKNPRSTVGTTTEVYDYFRLLFARAADAYSYESGERMVKYTEEKIIDLILNEYEGRAVMILAPLVRSRKGHYRELFEQVRRKGYLYVRIDGEIREAVPGLKVDRYKNHDIEVVIDKLKVQAKDDRRLRDSVAAAMVQGDGLLMLLDKDTGAVRHYSKRLMDPVTGLSYREPAPHNFSFNSPNGACPKCRGLGYITRMDMDKVIPDRSLSIRQGAILPLGAYKNTLIFRTLDVVLRRHDFTLDTPVSELDEETLDELFNGVPDRIKVQTTLLHESDMFISFDGIVKYLLSIQDVDPTAAQQRWIDQFLGTCTCPECGGARLNKEALSYRILGKNIADLSAMDIGELYEWTGAALTQLSGNQQKIAEEILKEIRVRLHFLLDVGLDYLALGRPSQSLSGGESQRIRLATQIGSQLVNVLYILDEPSIGLHQRDNERLIRSLKALRDIGNTVVVVEHDRDMMLSADYVIDLGPLAGRKGGMVVFAGTPAELMKADTLTAKYLKEDASPQPSPKGKGDESPLLQEGKGEAPKKPRYARRTAGGTEITLVGCRGNNLKNITVTFPLGKLICITGVSGSGKSTLVNDTLQPILSQNFYRSLREPLPYDQIIGMENVDKVVTVDQSPLGRTPRSNPATYTGVFSDIRNLFVSLPEAKMRGYKPGRFSFNISGGRCEACSGNGYKTIEMNFLPDVMVPCEVCQGRRYNHETLEVRFKGKSIADVLDMTINQAVEFFENVPTILNKIKVLQEVGLGYIKLGQPSSTLSGGESQRVKLATELAKRDTGHTLYILDEPTTGLHFEDIRVLMGVLRRLVDRGNTIIVIEHNLDVIRQADFIIDMGPEGGRRGGEVVVTGTPAEIAERGIGYTAVYLRKEIS
jgi:excinuclease ABC, A subunit